MTHPNKRNLQKELEVYLNPEDYCYKHKVNASFVIDVMENLRKVSVSPTSPRLSYFQDIVLALASLFSVYHQYGNTADVIMFLKCIQNVLQQKSVREGDAARWYQLSIVQLKLHNCFVYFDRNNLKCSTQSFIYF